MAKDALKKQFDKLNANHAVIMVGGKCLILNEFVDPVSNQHDVNFSKIEDFHKRYAPHKYPIEDGNGKTKPAAITKLWIESSYRRMYEGVVFDPKKTRLGYYNLYRGFAVEPRKGEWHFYRGHIREVIANGNADIYALVMAWMARIVQDPGGERPGTCIVLRGPQGTGKGCFANNFGGVLGSHFLPISNQVHVTGRFNKHLTSSLMVFLDEAFWAGDLEKCAGSLKALITEPEFFMEQKYCDPIKVKNRVNVIIASNADWVVPAGMKERRFCVLDVSPKRMGDRKYFDAIYEQMKNGGLEAMLYDLQRLDISDADLRSIPKTPALFEQITRSFNSVQSFWFECLTNRQIGQGEDSRKLPKEDVYEAYSDFCQRHRMRQFNASQFWKFMKRLCAIEYYRPRTGNESRRVYCKLPSFEDCRKQFSEKVGMTIPWEDEA
jgi:hypothetical protein